MKRHASMITIADCLELLYMLLGHVMSWTHLPRCLRGRAGVHRISHSYSAYISTHAGASNSPGFTAISVFFGTNVMGTAVMLLAVPVRSFSS
jgi:hypothetical protein